MALISDPLSQGMALGEKILGIGNTIIERVIPDKAAQEKAKAVLVQMHEAGELQITLRGADIVQEEAKGGWLQRNWRPMLMLMCMSVICNNYIIYPYFNLFGLKAMVLDLPEKLWSLMEIGVGGYVIGRSAEKISGVPYLSDIFKKK